MVGWNDALEHLAESHDDDFFDDTLSRIMPQISVGIAVRDDEHGVVIARDIHLTSGETQSEICIPKAYIIEKRYLK